MDETLLLKAKADILTKAPIIIEIDIKKRSRLNRLFQGPTKKVFKVNRACLGTLIFFSKLTLDMSRPEETFQKGLPELIATISNDGPLVIRLIALLIEDTDREPSKYLKRFLTKNLDVIDSKEVLIKLLSLSKVEDFMRTTILIRKMSLLKTEELIAFEEKQDKIFGELSAAL